MKHREFILSDVVIFSIPLLVAQIYFKYTYLKFGGLDIASRALGLHEFNAMNLMQFFAADLLEALLYFPLFLLVIGVFLRRSWRFFLFFLALQATIFVGVVSWVTYHSIGTFPSYQLVTEFIETYRVDPNSVAPTSVLPARQLFKIALLLLLCWVPVVVILIRPLNTIYQKTFKLVSIVMLAGIVIGISLATGATSKSIYHQGHNARIVAEFFRIDNVYLPATSNYTKEDLANIYDSVVFPDGEPVPNNNMYPRVPDVDFRPNVILIILETAGYEHYRFDSVDSTMTMISALSDNALIARNHFTTYPYSVRANFSLLASAYDLPFRSMMADYLMDGTPEPLDSLPNILRNHGYATHYYYPHKLSHANERWMLEYLGFDNIHAGPDSSSSTGGMRSDRQRIDKEVEFIKMVSHDLADLASQPAPFFITLPTSLGHAPYVDTRPAEHLANSPDISRDETLANLVAEVDYEIGLIIQALRTIGLLEKTILVITGDHGVRSTTENPSIDLRFINKESFHVPLLIHYPPVFRKTKYIDQLTSHIDIAPTILNLAGVTGKYHLQQGLPVYDDRIRHRVTYFLGGHFFGSNALHYQNNFYMVNYVSRTAYSSHDFSFTPDDMLLSDKDNQSDEAQEFEVMLSNLVQLQMDLLGHLLVLPPNIGN